MWADNIKCEIITEFLVQSNSSEVYQKSLMQDLFAYFFSLAFICPFLLFEKKIRKNVFSSSHFSFLK